MTIVSFGGQRLSASFMEGFTLESRLHHGAHDEILPRDKKQSRCNTCNTYLSQILYNSIHSCFLYHQVMLRTIELRYLGKTLIPKPPGVLMVHNSTESRNFTELDARPGNARPTTGYISTKTKHFPLRTSPTHRTLVALLFRAYARRG